jgi:hypothetical protein
MQDVKSKGMSAAVFQGVTEAQWTSLELSNKKIRFICYMEVTSSGRGFFILIINGEEEEKMKMQV